MDTIPDPGGILSTADRILNTRLFQLSGQEVNLVTLLTFALIVLATWIASRMVRSGIERGFTSRGVRDRGTIGVTNRLVHYGIMAIGLAVALNTIGINLAALFAAGAVLGIAIGFAMQNIVQNFVSGLILLVERTIKPGDVLEVEGRVVQVEKMGIRTSIARTRDEEELIVPNATLVQSTVKNYTLRDSLFRVRTPVGVRYDSDMRRVFEVLAGAAERVADRFEGREPLVLLKEFGDSAVIWETSVWIQDPWRSQRVSSELNQAIWWALQEAGITIAFPQMDVHLDAPVEAGISGLSRVS